MAKDTGSVLAYHKELDICHYVDSPLTLNNISFNLLFFFSAFGRLGILSVVVSE